MNLTLKKPKGFILINGISVKENRKASISIANQLVTNKNGNQDLKIVDLYEGDENTKINKKNYHPRFSRFWNEKPTIALNFFKTLPRFNKVKVMVIHGFDLLANADTSNTIQNNLLKPFLSIDIFRLFNPLLFVFGCLPTATKTISKLSLEIFSSLVSKCTVTLLSLSSI